MSRVIRLALRLFGAWWSVEFARGAIEGLSERRPVQSDDVAAPATPPRRHWPLAA